MRKKIVHMAGLFGASGKRRTWCGRLVDDSQLPIIGTNRTANCLACVRSNQAKEHSQRWDYSYRRMLKKILRARQSDAS